MVSQSQIDQAIASTTDPLVIECLTALAVSQQKLFAELVEANRWSRVYRAKLAARKANQHIPFRVLMAEAKAAAIATGKTVKVA